MLIWAAKFSFSITRLPAGIPKQNQDYSDPLSPTEGTVHTLMGFRRLGIVSEAGLVLMGVGQHCHEFVERRKVVALGRRLDDRFDTVVPGDEGGICQTHGSAPRVGLLWLLR